jgi:hypothetical protein
MQEQVEQFPQENNQHLNSSSHHSNLSATSTTTPPAPATSNSNTNSPTKQPWWMSSTTELEEIKQKQRRRNSQKVDVTHILLDALEQGDDHLTVELPLGSDHTVGSAASLGTNNSSHHGPSSSQSGPQQPKKKKIIRRVIRRTVSLDSKRARAIRDQQQQQQQQQSSDQATNSSSSQQDLQDQHPPQQTAEELKDSNWNDWSKSKRRSKVLSMNIPSSHHSSAPTTTTSVTTTSRSSLPSSVPAQPRKPLSQSPQRSIPPRSFSTTTAQRAKDAARKKGLAFGGRGTTNSLVVDTQEVEDIIHQEKKAQSVFTVDWGVGDAEDFVKQLAATKDGRLWNDTLGERSTSKSHNDTAKQDSSSNNMSWQQLEHVVHTATQQHVQTFRSMPKLKRAAFTLILSQLLTPQERQELYQIFTQMEQEEEEGKDVAAGTRTSHKPPSTPGNSKLPPRRISRGVSPRQAREGYRRVFGVETPPVVTASTIAENDASQTESPAAPATSSSSSPLDSNTTAIMDYSEFVVGAAMCTFHHAEGDNDGNRKKKRAQQLLVGQGESLRRAFGMFDQEGKGFISKENLMELCSHQDATTQQIVEHIFSSLGPDDETSDGDTRGEDNISFADFVAMFFGDIGGTSTTSSGSTLSDPKKSKRTSTKKSKKKDKKKKSKKKSRKSSRKDKAGLDGMTHDNVSIDETTQSGETGDDDDDSTTSADDTIDTSMNDGSSSSNSSGGDNDEDKNGKSNKVPTKPAGAFDWQSYSKTRSSLKVQSIMAKAKEKKAAVEKIEEKSQSSVVGTLRKIPESTTPSVAFDTTQSTAPAMAKSTPSGGPTNTAAKQATTTSSSVVHRSASTGSVPNAAAGLPSSASFTFPKVPLEKTAFLPADAAPRTTTTTAAAALDISIEDQKALKNSHPHFPSDHWQWKVARADEILSQVSSLQTLTSEELSTLTSYLHAEDAVAAPSSSSPTNSPGSPQKQFVGRVTLGGAEGLPVPTVATTTSTAIADSAANPATANRTSPPPSMTSAASKPAVSSTAIAVRPSSAASHSADAKPPPATASATASQAPAAAAASRITRTSPAQAATSQFDRPLPPGASASTATPAMPPTSSAAASGNNRPVTRAASAPTPSAVRSTPRTTPVAASTPSRPAVRVGAVSPAEPRSAVATAPPTSRPATTAIPAATKTPTKAATPIIKTTAAVPAATETPTTAATPIVKTTAAVPAATTTPTKAATPIKTTAAVPAATITPTKAATPTKTSAAVPAATKAPTKAATPTETTIIRRPVTKSSTPSAATPSPTAAGKTPRFPGNVPRDPSKEPATTTGGAKASIQHFPSNTPRRGAPSTTNSTATAGKPVKAVVKTTKSAIASPAAPAYQPNFPSNPSRGSPSAGGGSMMASTSSTVEEEEEEERTPPPLPENAEIEANSISAKAGASDALNSLMKNASKDPFFKPKPLKYMKNSKKPAMDPTEMAEYEAQKAERKQNAQQAIKNYYASQTANKPKFSKAFLWELKSNQKDLARKLKPVKQHAKDKKFVDPDRPYREELEEVQAAVLPVWRKETYVYWI